MYLRDSPGDVEEVDLVVDKKGAPLASGGNQEKMEAIRMESIRMEAIREDLAANLFDFWAHRERLVGEARDRAWKAERKTFLNVVDNQLYYLEEIGASVNLEKVKPDYFYNIRSKFVVFYSTR